MTHSKENITQELLARLKNGDMLAFDQVYETYCHKLFSFVFKILRNEAEADDIVQEVFVKIWESRDRLDDYKCIHPSNSIFSMRYHETTFV